MSLYANNEDFKGFVQTLISVMPSVGKEVFREFSFPVGRATTCTVKFDGPVSIDEWDSLLAHVAFYKTFFKPEMSDMLVWTPERLGHALDEALARRAQIEGPRDAA